MGLASPGLGGAPKSCTSNQRGVLDVSPAVDNKFGIRISVAASKRAEIFCFMTRD